jgi:hypothetical protein
LSPPVACTFIGMLSMFTLLTLAWSASFLAFRALSWFFIAFSRSSC